ncbi:spinster family MFS transporter [Altericroceibacterium xinjiangense]|uniref:spinster family MFS transporter n=1 Tax=Altericroceibacterium xinjiangense TaxID=762261 RepID=UPI000F7DA8E2|nr:MFS transporter [Altericroceibacterium xinjiangense]
MALKTRRDAPWLALIILTAISTVGFIDRIVLNVLAVPIQAEFGITDTQVGLLTGLAFAVLNVTLGIAVARYAERGPRVSLIAIGTMLWSLATAACGLVGSFMQLLFARIGVGVGEAVGLPATQSVVADYFPAERRATALSVLLLAPPIGALLGSAGGGWIAQNFGWRMAFFIATIPGLLLAVAAWALIAEPPRGRYDREKSADVPPIGAVFSRLFRLKSARQLLFGSTIASMVGFGLNSFVAFLLVRRFDFSLAEAGLFAGLLASFPGAVAVLVGGWAADRFGKRNPAAYALIPGIALLIASPLYMFAITRDHVVLLLALTTIAALFQYTYLGVTYGVFQNLLHSRMRATGSALLNAMYGLIGQGLGPLLVGFLSDRFLASGYSPGRGLAYAMALTAAIYLWAALHYLLAARHVGPDLARVRED